MSLLLANQASPPPTPPLPRCSTKQPLPQSAPPCRKAVSSASSLGCLYLAALPPCQSFIIHCFPSMFFPRGPDPASRRGFLCILLYQFDSSKPSFLTNASSFFIRRITYALQTHRLAMPPPTTKASPGRLCRSRGRAGHSSYLDISDPPHPQASPGRLGFPCLRCSLSCAELTPAGG